MSSFVVDGSGSMAAIWAQALAGSKRHRLLAVGSRQVVNARRLADGYGAAVLDEAAGFGAADVLVVATAPAAHAAGAQRGAAAALATVIEAPLCTTLADADQLVRAEADGARLAYAENLLFAPLVRDALDRIGRLGPLHHIGVRVLLPPPVRRSPFDAAWGGGVLFDTGVHPLALLLALVGADRPVAVSAQLEAMAGTAGDDPDDAVDDLARVTLTLRSGARCTLELSWRSQQPQWDLQVATASSALRMELLPDPHLEQLGVDLPRPPRRRPDLQPAQLEVFGYLDQLHEVADDFAQRRPPYVTVAFGRQVLDVIAAAYRSAATGVSEALPFVGPRDRTPQELWRGGGRSG